MITAITSEADALADLADRLTALSIALYHYRSQHPLSAADELAIRDHAELSLDTLANLLRSQAVGAIGKAALDHAADLTAALTHAEQTIKKIESTKAAMAVVADVIGLVGAVLSKQPKAIVAALKPFHKGTGDTQAPGSGDAAALV